MLHKELWMNCSIIFLSEMIFHVADFSLLFSAINDALLENLLKLDLQLQEAKDSFIESSNLATSDTEEVS